MKDNFDLKKYIKDNKIIEKSNKYVAATLNEEEVKKETPKKEKIEENVDLKSKIKEMVLAELSEDVELEEDESIYEETVTEKKLGKKGKEFYKGIKKADSYMKEEVEEDESEDNVEAEEEVEVVDAEDTPAETDTPTDTGGIMGNLEAAIEKARELGDEKLIDQIGNTITFYTRQYISK